MGRLFDFFFGGSWLGRLASFGVGFGVLWTAYQFDRAEQRQIGRVQEKVKTGKANDQVIKRSDVVRARSRDKRVRGTVDPNYID